ncbi:E3 ubiquitin-protein ligase MGRN1 isoform X2 [Bacillus rossius redtenbacheri]|uniref:E3 ubiquitin-protein ligase MGRN1 isoform X2 n=1 Tax=Bacillus rossius redtenbacheri TaxID=93214 RepID=UPI002FDCD767
MGALTSRQHVGVEEVDIVSNHAYKYPPRSGNYFGSHFIMGGERFDTPQPESYLFGENVDLNFLGSRPTPFPYPPPQANEPTKTLKSLVNIRKESLRFVRTSESISKCATDDDGEYLNWTNFNIEFTFDCDVRCAITIYYFCTEEVTTNGVVYTPRDPGMNSATYHYKRGANQQFSQVSHVFNPCSYHEDELTYDPDREVIPIAIHCVTEEGAEELRQSHTTIAVVDHHSDGTYVLRALKQKLYVDGLCYLLQEIYGIENKNNESKGASDEDTEDNGSECVICMCDVRDTLILPCRHLCLCNSCADSLRYQANNCPICRAPFRALLQIRALQKSATIPQDVPLPTEGSDNIPAGYEPVSLIEALNGPCLVRSAPTVPPLDMAETPDQEVAVQAAEVLNRSNLEIMQCNGKQLGSPDDCSIMKSVREKVNGVCSTPEFRMSVLLSRDEEGAPHKQQTTKSPLLVRHGRDKGALVGRQRDTIRLVNEKSPREPDETVDDDSEAEKLSPLLDAATVPLDVADLPPVDDLDEEDDVELKVELQEEEALTSATSQGAVGSKTGSRDGASDAGLTAVGDDSDYYTPEDPATTILSPLHCDKERERAAASAESTPGRWAVGASLPSTPLSHLSNRSSGDSYSSGGSTRQLLAPAAALPPARRP